MLCPNCGVNVSDGDVFCQTCGQKVVQEQPTSQEQTAPQEQTKQEQPVQQPVYQQPIQQPIYQQPIQPPPYTRQPMPQPGYNPPIYNQPMKRKKGKGCLIALGVLIIIIATIVLCLIFFFKGFFEPKDLGIKSSKSAYESAMSKLGYTKDDAPTGSDPDDYNYIYGPLHDVDAALTSEELTSFFNYNRPEYYALDDVQIRINSDDTMEMSCSLDLKYFIDEVLGGKYTQEEIEEKMPMLGILPHKVNLYCKISGEINNNTAEDFDVSDIEVQGFGIPKTIYTGDEATKNIEDIVTSALSRVTAKNGSSFDSVKIDDGKLMIDALMPSSLVREEIN